MYGQFVFTQQYTTDNGLMSNDIQALYKDSRGMLWIGSKSGVLVKNMDKFVGVIQINENKFKNIRSIIEDQNNDMWIGSYEHGVLRLNGNDKSDVFNKQNGLSSDYVRKLFTFKNLILVGTSKGVSIIDINTKKIFVPQNNNIIKGEISNFFQYKNNVYACTDKGVIYHVDFKKNVINYVTYFNGITSVLPFNDNFYYGTNKGVLKYNKASKKISLYDSIPYVWAYSVKNNGAIYFVASSPTNDDGGLFQIQNNTILELTDKFQIPHRDLISISIDHEKNTMYLGSRNNGLIELIFDNPVKKISSGDKIYTTSKFDNALFVFSQEGLKILDEKDEIKNEIPLISFLKYHKNNIKKYSESLKKDSELYDINSNLSHNQIQFYKSIVYGNKLYVSSNIGLFVLNAKGEFINYYPIHALNFSIYKNKFIQSSVDGGIRIFDDLDKFRYNYYVKNSQQNMPHKVVDFVIINDILYIASSHNGVHKYDGFSFKSLNEEVNFKEINLKNLGVSPNGNLIVVTVYDDLYEINLQSKKTHKKFSSSDIKGKEIQSLLVADSKYFIATNKGLNVLENNLKYLIDYEQGLETFNFTSFSRFSGNVYIGTKNGLYKVTEYFENVVNDYKPNVNIYNIDINGEKIERKENYKWFNLNIENLELPHNKNNIKIYFTDWKMKFPKKIKFKYRLKEDEEWSAFLNENVIDLNYLQPGDYNLELFIENLSTGKTYQVKLLNIKITPVFYQTWSFYILATISLLIISYCIYRYNIRLVKRRETEKNRLVFSKQEEEQKRIQAENDKISLEKDQIELKNRLHVAKTMALRSQMNPHFIFNALNTLQYFIVTQDRENGLNYLSKFSKLVRETLENSINDFITLREEIDYLNVYTSIENMRFQDRQVLFDYIVEEGLDIDTVLIPPMISQPFVENCFMHAFDESICNPKVIFRYKKNDNYLVCSIEDNGLGFLEKDFNIEIHKSRGLKLVEERTGMLSPNLAKTLYVESLNTGTKITIYLPFITKQNDFTT